MKISRTLTHLLFCLFISANLFGQTMFKTGEPVEIEWSGAWYKGRVLDANEGKYKISYDGYSSSWDEWVLPKRLRRPVGITTASPVANSSSGIYKKGDRVEVSYAGDWHRATIIAGPEGDGAQAVYEAKMDGYQYAEKYGLSRLRPLYRPNEKQTFATGNKVLFQRWDGKEYEGEIVGIDGPKYHLSYTRDGVKTSEWVPEIGVKESPNNRVTAPRKFPGQKYQTGERVMYDNGSFLTSPRYGTVVSVDVEKRLYTVKDEKDASSRYTYPCYGLLAPGEKPDNRFFIGKWEVYIAGATSTFIKDGDRYRRFSGGMKLKTLEIKSDGTYAWQTDKNTIRGRWKAREGVPGITLLKGMDGRDWTIYESTEALAAQKSTRDEIRFHHLPSQSGYYQAYRIGPNQSCVLQDRKF